MNKSTFAKDMYKDSLFIYLFTLCFNTKNWLNTGKKTQGTTKNLKYKFWKGKNCKQFDLDLKF